MRFFITVLFQKYDGGFIQQLPTPVTESYVNAYGDHDARR